MEKYSQIMEELYNIAEELDNQQILNISKFLSQRINNPDSYLVFLGETCGGKSRLINSIIGKNVLPVSGVPSTGAIAEVCLKNSCFEDEFYAINTNATMEIIDENLFRELSLKPDAGLERVRYVTSAPQDGFDGVRIFDTPGYGSLLKEHEEVLTNFLPNADAIVYIVSYRVGFQEDDYEFLKDLFGFVRKGVPFYLFINRCPQGTSTDDRRVREIYDYVKTLLQLEEVPLSIIESFNEDSDCHKILIDTMGPIINNLNSEDRRNELKQAFAGYIKELIGIVRCELERRQRNKQMTEEQKKSQNESLLDYISTIEKAEEKIIKPGFERIYNTYPIKVRESKKHIDEETNTLIDEQSKLSKDETTAYISRHVINYKAKKEVENLQFYLETELNALDAELNDYLNKAIVKFEKDLKLKNPTYSYKAGVDLVKNGGTKLLNAGLLRYFAQYGGAGGSGAGVANAASHALKKVGDLVGKTFSRETHNALKHVLSVLKLTSTKAISAAAAGIIETIALIVDINIWKTKLKHQVKKTTDDWARELESVVMDDLKNLEKDNIKLINEMIINARQAFDTDSSEVDNDVDSDSINRNIKKLDELEGMVA